MASGLFGKRLNGVARDLGRGSVAALLGAVAGAASAQPFDFAYYDRPMDGRDSVEALAREADQLVPMLQSDVTVAMAEACQQLPTRYQRWLWASRDQLRVYTMSEYEELPEEDREGLSFRAAPPQTYYEGLQQVALSVLRSFDLGVSGTPMAERNGLEGKRVLVSNYLAYISLRLPAAVGADVVGVSSNAVLTKLFTAPKDQGEIESVVGSEPGTVTLAAGRWPGDPEVFGDRAEAVREVVGGGYDLIVFHNTYRAGFATPAAPRRVGGNEPFQDNYGAEPAEMAKWLSESLNPGGRVVMYNFAGAQRGVYANYDASLDLRCPISVEEAEAAGLKAVAFDADDGVGFWSYLKLAEATQIQGRRLDYNVIQASYTVFEKPAR